VYISVLLQTIILPSQYINIANKVICHTKIQYATLAFVIRVREIVVVVVVVEIMYIENVLSWISP